ncbi:hypothetical protein HK405_003544, partial [Cladochytrium tenue]
NAYHPNQPPTGSISGTVFHGRVPFVYTPTVTGNGVSATAVPPASTASSPVLSHIQHHQPLHHFPPPPPGPAPSHFVPATSSGLPQQNSVEAATDPQSLETNLQKLKPQELDYQPSSPPLRRTADTITGSALHHQPVSGGQRRPSDASGRPGATASAPNGHPDDRGNMLRLSPLLLGTPRASDAGNGGGGGGGDSGADVAPTSAAQISDVGGTPPKAESEVAAASGRHQAVAAA